MPLSENRATAILAVLGAFGLAGCGSGTLPPCDAPERRAQARHVQAMPTATRDSILRAFTERSRIQQVTFDQQVCHLRATMLVDSFATKRYASVQGLALIRAFKEHAPGETRSLVDEPTSEVGVGLYDYAVEIKRQGEHEAKTPGERNQAPWVRLTKPYHDRRVTVRR